MRSNLPMRARALKVLGSLALLAGMLAAVLPAATGQQTSATAIERVLDDQVAAWNRGDVDGFMHGYKDSPETTFIGKSVEHGYAPILARYRRAYPNAAAMGKLDFSEIAVRSLGENYAVATGKFHLTRATAGGGDASGLFSLTWEKTSEGWKIILDHTSVLP